MRRPAAARARRTRRSTARRAATARSCAPTSSPSTTRSCSCSALLAMGRWNDAFVSVGLGLVNAMISAAQEISAKRKLDGLQLLDAAEVVVVRDGAEVAVAPAEVVRG